MARSSMADLIAAVRSLIHDEDAEAPVFTDDTIQLVLDRTRRYHRYAPLTPEPEYPSGVATYLIYHAPDDAWESDLLLTDGQYETLEASEDSEPLLGRFVFDASQIPPVLISGKSYDIYESAADMCEVWAQALVLDFDFAATGESFQRSQKAKGLREMARTFRAHAKPEMRSLSRTDETG